MLLTVTDVMNGWRPGSADHDWPAEIGDLIFRDREATLALIESVRRDGLRAPLPGEEPVTLGDDGRVWGGHHRIVAGYIVDPRSVVLGVVHGCGGRGSVGSCPHPARERDVCTCNDPAEGPERPPRRAVRWSDLATCQAIALADR